MNRPRVALTLLMALVIGAPTLGSASIALADADPVTERAEITYRLDRAHEEVQVTARIRYTNQIPSTATARYYLEQWGPIAIPTYARTFRVRGSGARAQRVPTGGPFDNVIVSFRRIYRGSTAAFTASWVLPSKDAGSSADIRVSDAYSHFCWTGQPMDSVSVRAIIPRALEVVTRGSPTRTSRHGSSRVLTARRQGDPATFYACTDVYDPRLLVRTDVQGGGAQSVRVEGWPGDQAWQDAATAGLTQALSGVELVVGLTLPDGKPIRVREVASNALMGYGGEFDPGSGIIRVGEAGVSPQLLAHELAHAWFNDRTVTPNWLWEGLAEWAARRAVGSSLRTSRRVPGQRFAAARQMADPGWPACPPGPGGRRVPVPCRVLDHGAGGECHGALCHARGPGGGARRQVPV